MITIAMTENSLTIDGHAARPDGVPPGQNIVCAAVSALVLTLAEGLDVVAGMEIDAHWEEGHASIEWKDINEKGQALVDAWLLGIRGIRDSYGEITIL